MVYMMQAELVFELPSVYTRRYAYRHIDAGMYTRVLTRGLAARLSCGERRLDERLQQRRFARRALLGLGELRRALSQGERMHHFYEHVYVHFRILIQKGHGMAQVTLLEAVAEGAK